MLHKSCRKLKFAHKNVDLGTIQIGTYEITLGIKVEKMSLSVSYNQNINSGIDSAALKEVAAQIFKRADAKSSDISTKFDLSKFNRATLGTDLYGGRVDASTANQIAMTKVGMQVSLSSEAVNSLKYLSSEASKSIFKDVEGKIAIPETKEISERVKAIALPTFGKLVETLELGSDKKGSNPFYKGELLQVEKSEEKDELNIFA